MKYFITIITIILLTGCSNDVQLGAVEEKINIEKEVLRIEKEQEKINDGKYKFKPKYNKDGLDYEVHEYITPDGEDGYQIIIEGDGFQRSIGYGAEAEERTWEITNLATSTL